jgi:ATP-binding cassette subfamily F protein uup
VLEDSLAEFPGAVVLVSHDRDLMDRLCTEVIGLDGRGGARLYGSIEQWLTAFERGEAEAAKTPARPAATTARRPAQSANPGKLSYREQQELAGMEAAISAADALASERLAEVERSATSGHEALAQACRKLEEAQRAVDALYARWQELEARRGV